jgi:Flp pilus assembly protein TadG
LNICVPSRARDQRGAAVVEFALVASILVTLVIGIISYGYMLSFRQGISQGAAEGARAAAVAATAAAQKPDAVDAVNEALNSYGVSCNETTSKLMRSGSPVGTCSVVIAACTNNAAQTCASVNLDYAYRDNALVPSFPGLGVLLPENLSYTSVARVSS